MALTLLRCFWLSKPKRLSKFGLLKLRPTYVHTSQILKNANDNKKFRSYVLGRYVEYVKHYEKILEKKFPSAMRVYRVFMVGIQDFYTDLKTFLGILKIMNTAPNGLKALNRKEIELYHQMPKDMVRVAPVLLISALPFANYVIFPLAFSFPRLLLSSHFWSIQQKSEFALISLRNRLRHQKPILLSIHAHCAHITDPDLQETWSGILALLGSGQQPSAVQLISCNKLFTERPYHFDLLGSTHIRQLLKLHVLHPGLFRRKRLADRARIINEMDLAIVREGGVHNMPIDAMKRACFLRGLNPLNVSQVDLEHWLNEWIQVTTSRVIGS